MQQPFISTDSILVRFIVEPRYRWLRHGTLWLVLLIFSYENIMSTYSDDLEVLGWTTAVLILIQFGLYLSFYINIYLLVPRLFLKGRYVAYSLSLWILLSLVFACSYGLEYIVNMVYALSPSPASYISDSRWVIIDYISMISVVGMSILGTTITILFRNWLTDGKRKQDMESEHGRKQVMKFKDIVNPAFLSDTLSVAAGYTDINADLTADTLIRLSRYLRYRLYDSNREVVFLNSEAAFLDNYLSLITDIRKNFSYSITSHPGMDRALLPPSVLSGVTDAVLNNIEEGSSVDLAIEFGTDEKMGIIMDFTVQSSANLSCRYIGGDLETVPGISYLSDYEIMVRGGGEKLYIRLISNNAPGV